MTTGENKPACIREVERHRAVTEAISPIEVLADILVGTEHEEIGIILSALVKRADQILHDLPN